MLKLNKNNFRLVDFTSEQKDVTILRDQIAYLRRALQDTEKNLQNCQHVSVTISSKAEVYSALEEFISIFTKQYLGILVGILGSLIFRFFDQKVASRIAKRYNIKQRDVMTFAFPTFVCFVQYLLRKRSKDSKLAALLSILKKQQHDDSEQTKQTASPNSNPDKVTKSKSNMSQSFSTPRPLSSFSSVDTDCDSVFYSTHKKQAKGQSKTQSVSVRYSKKSQVSIKMSSLS